MGEKDKSVAAEPRKLEIMFEMQRALNEDIASRRGLDMSDRGEWIQRQALALMSELAEVVDEAGFKWWKNRKEIDGGKLKEEIVDVFHFFLSMCITAGMDAEELFEKYLEKNKENFDRQNGKSSRTGYCADEAGRVL